jgi:membrane-associated phospholipid phosphatase
MRFEQRIQTTAAGVDYLTNRADWHRVLCGQLAGVNAFDSERRYIRNGRDLGEYVHRDFSYQPYLVACLIALYQGALPDGGSPYKHSRTQSGFATFGQPFLYYALAVASQAALRACWFYKWLVHRRLRPEEYGGLVHHRLTGALDVPLHAQLLESEAVAATRERFGTALLPQSYPDGSPTHPAYPSGHASMMGASATVLKACLDENHVFTEPVVASADGTRLEPWKGEDLTVGGELDKLASNISIGRLFAGIHWRTDASAGIALGEEVGIQVLKELALTGNELFTSWSLRKFDGERVSIG